MLNTIKMFNQNIERKFWEVVIPLMRKEPEIVEKLAGIGLFFADRVPKKNLLVQSLFWICMGLTLGLGIGILLP